MMENVKHKISLKEIPYNEIHFMKKDDKSSILQVSVREGLERTRQYLRRGCHFPILRHLPSMPIFNMSFI